ncbi:MAG: HflK protein, partial [Amylibacter sp.]
EKQADAYSNKVVAAARGEAAQLIEQAEGYRSQTVNEAEGEASRFIAVYEEYAKAPDVTRKRLYLETMERVLGSVNKIIIDESAGGQGVVPYLPLNELNKSSGGSN